MDAIVKSEAPALPGDGAFSPDFRAFVAACLPKDARARATAAALLAHPFITVRHPLRPAPPARPRRARGASVEYSDFCQCARRATS